MSLLPAGRDSLPEQQVMESLVLPVRVLPAPGREFPPPFAFQPNAPMAVRRARRERPDCPVLPGICVARNGINRAGNFADLQADLLTPRPAAVHVQSAEAHSRGRHRELEAS